MVTVDERCNKENKSITTEKERISSILFKRCKTGKEDDITTEKKRFSSILFKRCKKDREEDIAVDNKRELNHASKTEKGYGCLLAKNDSSLVIQDIDVPSNIFFVSNYDSDPIAWQTFTPPASVRGRKRTHVPVELVGSCNGLLCIRYLCLRENKTMFCVCNPISDEFSILPASPPVTHLISGFGFCPKTKQYKVIRFIHDSNYFEIHTLGTDHWRRIDAPCPSVRLSDSSYKGNLHWHVKCNSIQKMICSFNLETEQYSYLSPPSQFTPDLCRRMTFIYIGTLGGLFCISYLLDQVHFEAWVMKDYGVKESWTKKISIKPNCDLHHVLKLLDNGVLLLNYSYDAIVCYKTVTGTTTKVMVGGNYCAMPLVPDSSSLKDIVRPKNVEEVQKNCCASSRLQLH